VNAGRSARYSPVALLVCIAGAALCGEVAVPARGGPVLPTPSTQLVGGAYDYTVEQGDSLTSVGARFGVGAIVLARRNGLAPKAQLALGQELHVENPHIVPPVTAAAAGDAILINVPQRMLFQWRGGAVVAGYPIAAGRPTWRTPLGEFEIDARATDKTWIVPVSIQEEMRREGKPVKKIVPPGPDNPLGRHWLGLTRSSIGIHGTTAPASIYALRTHGCIRLHPDDAAALYERTPLGEPVHIVYEPVLLAALADGRICLEAHPDAYRLRGSAEDAIADLTTTAGLAERIDWPRVREVLEARDGIAEDVTLGANGRSCT